MISSLTLYLLRTPQGNSGDTEELRPSQGAKTATHLHFPGLKTILTQPGESLYFSSTQSSSLYVVSKSDALG